ncbi:MAG: PP2C family serine/threonine-protein phosphatase [Syntrophobacteraceae bacterium]
MRTHSPDGFRKSLLRRRKAAVHRVDSREMQIESITNQGLRRKGNEDRYLVNALDNGRALLVIADGMGGHAAGEVAAQLAVDSFERFSPPDHDIGTELAKRMEEAHGRILEYSLGALSFKGMGTTLTALFINGRSAFWAHVGDTRIYLFHKGSLTQVTDDHTIPGRLLKRGEITREQARFHPYGNVLTRCAGCERHEPDSGTFDLAPGDLVLLSSDGLHDLMGDEQIAAILRADIPLREKLDSMISVCLEAGGRDNITGVLAAI